MKNITLVEKQDIVIIKRGQYYGFRLSDGSEILFSEDAFDEFADKLGKAIGNELEDLLKAL